MSRISVLKNADATGLKKPVSSHARTKVFVAMSGGVDSSVSAALLKEQGYDVYGIFMQGWQNPHFECTWKEDRQDAARVAGILDIPFRVLDFSKEYYDKVVSYLIAEYRAGRTPNPDVMCNKEIKFGLFYEWAREQGADFVATGHYALIQSGKLYVAEDKNKDQTYFLWTLTPDILKHTLFPIGSIPKPEVRKIAEKFGLPTASKKDSQGICFIGKGSMADFLKDHIEAHKGDIKTSDGVKVGEHPGLEYFTIGQRHGIGLQGGTGTYYVAAKDISTNTLVVAKGDDDEILYQKEVSYMHPNWITKPRSFPFVAEARIRYRQPLAHCMVYEDRVIFDEPRRAVSPGQSIVFYKNGKVLGGGIIV